MKKINAPKATRLPSGAWRCQVMVNGVRQSFTGSSKADVEEAALKCKLEGQTGTKVTLTLDAVAKAYIEERRPVLSPSTIRGYKFAMSQFAGVRRMKLSAITLTACQKEINAMVGKYAPKTIYNVWGFYNAVFRQHGLEFNVALPQIVQNERPFLQPEQIPAFLEAIRGSKYEIPILLGLHGLRRSEILNVEWNDIDLENGTVRVAGAAVFDEDDYLVHRAENKNAASNRIVPILIPRLAELVNSSPKAGRYVCSCDPGRIRKAVNTICERNGLPLIGTHGLRHSFASACYFAGLSIKATQKLGGWSDYNTMQKVYTHLADSALTEAQQKLTGLFAHGLHTDS